MCVSNSRNKFNQTLSAPFSESLHYGLQANLEVCLGLKGDVRQQQQQIYRRSAIGPLPPYLERNVSNAYVSFVLCLSDAEAFLADQRFLGVIRIWHPLMLWDFDPFPLLPVYILGLHLPFSLISSFLKHLHHLSHSQSNENWVKKRGSELNHWVKTTWYSQLLSWPFWGANVNYTHYDVYLPPCSK